MPISKQKRGSKKTEINTRAFPEHERLLDFRWRINQTPEVCVRDITINKFLRLHGGKTVQKISGIDGLGEEQGKDLAETLADLLTGYRFVAKFTPTFKPGNFPGTYVPPIGPRYDKQGKNDSGSHESKPIKTKIPGLNGDTRLAYQRLREWSDYLSPVPYRGKHLKTKIICLMVKTLTEESSWEKEEAFRVIAEAFTLIGEPLTRAAVRKTFFRSRR